eukprot:gene11915-13149_t
MAAVVTCMKCVQNVLFKPESLSISRTFSCTPVVWKKDIRPTTRRPERPKRKLLKPAEDVSFLYTKAARRTFPYHAFNDAMSVLRAYAQTDENVGINVRFNVQKDKAKAESINGTMLLPKQFKQKKILVFAEGSDAAEAKDAGADIVGGKELIPQVEAEEFEFDYCLSSIEFFPNISHLSTVLRKQMPDTMKGTATNKLGFAVTEYKRGLNYRTTKLGFLCADIAKLNFTNDEIEENLQAFINTLKAHKPEDMKTSTFINRLTITTQYGPGLTLQKMAYL